MCNRFEGFFVSFNILCIPEIKKPPVPQHGSKITSVGFKSTNSQNRSVIWLGVRTTPRDWPSPPEYETNSP